MARMRWLVVALVVALGVTACARGSSDAAPDKPGGTTTTGAGSAGAGDFGTLRRVCRPGDPRGATAQGVTPDSITVGTFSDPGSPLRPGLNQELFDTAEVFVAWCNDHGGVNGRRIVLDKHDAALRNVRPQMAAACRSDFFLVGGGAALDQEGVKPRLECMLPAIPGFAVSVEARGADLQVQPLPNGATTQQLGPFVWLADKYPQAIEHVGILWGALGPGGTTAGMREEQVEAAGGKVVYKGTYPVVGQVSWAWSVEKMRSQGVRALVWVGEPENLATLAQALRDANYELDFVVADSNHYDRKLIDLGGASVSNVYVIGALVPFEKARGNPATREYLELFAKYKPNGRARTYLGIQAMSAWLLFATSADRCGADLTRRCVYENARKVRGWTGGGLHAPQEPGNGRASECYMFYKAGPDGFTFPDIDANEGPFNCAPGNVLDLKGDYGRPITLADVGRSMSDLG